VEVFLSNIGGQMSIWLGVRLITIMHLIYYGSIAVIYVLPVDLRRLKKRVRFYANLSKTVSRPLAKWRAVTRCGSRRR